MTSKWLKIEPIRHQAAIAGSVTDAETGAAIARARVEIAAGPAAFTNWLAIKAKQFGERWNKMNERLDRTYTATDGHFHFLDLPNGQYTLVVSLPSAGSRYAKAQVTATVFRDDDETIQLDTTTITLSPTAVKGQVTDESNDDPVVMAEIRIKGSVERTFSDSQGHYLLNGLETGKRTVFVSAQGYQRATQAVSLDQAGTNQTLDFILSRVQ